MTNVGDAHDLREALEDVEDPALFASLRDLGTLASLEAANSSAKVVVRVPYGDDARRDELANRLVGVGRHEEELDDEYE